MGSAEISDRFLQVLESLKETGPVRIATQRRRAVDEFRAQAVPVQRVFRTSAMVFFRTLRPCLPIPGHRGHVNDHLALAKGVCLRIDILDDLALKRLAGVEHHKAI